MAKQIATYEYLNKISSYPMPYNSSFPNALKRCVNNYSFAMEKSQNGYFFDLQYTGNGGNTPPWSLDTRDEFSVRPQSPTYHCKLTLDETPSGWKTQPIVIKAGVWNGMNSGIVSNSTVINQSSAGSTYIGFSNPAVYLQGGYGNETSNSPGITSTTGATFVKGNVFDVIGTGAGTYDAPIIGYVPTPKVLSSSYSNNTTTTVSITTNTPKTVYVAFFYFSNTNSTKFYVNWVKATLSLIYEARWT